MAHERRERQDVPCGTRDPGCVASIVARDMNLNQELDMPRPSQNLAVLAALVLATGCSRPEPQQQAQTAAPAGVQWAVIVLYNQPKDTAAFEKYYAEKHVPLFASHAQEIGVTRPELLRVAPGADGKPAAIYREADLRWDSKDARDKGMATAGFKAGRGGMPDFATGGVNGVVGQKNHVRGRRARGHPPGPAGEHDHRAPV